MSVFCMMRGINKWTVRPNTGIVAYFVFVSCPRCRWYISIFMYSITDKIEDAFYIIVVHCYHMQLLYSYCPISSCLSWWTLISFDFKRLINILLRRSKIIEWWLANEIFLQGPYTRAFLSIAPGNVTFFCALAFKQNFCLVITKTFLLYVTLLFQYTTKSFDLDTFVIYSYNHNIYEYC